MIINFATRLTDLQMIFQFGPLTGSQRARIREGAKLFESLVVVHSVVFADHGLLLPNALDNSAFPQPFQTAIKMVANIPQWLVEFLGDFS